MTKASFQIAPRRHPVRKRIAGLHCVQIALDIGANILRRVVAENKLEFLPRPDVITQIEIATSEIEACPVIAWYCRKVTFEREYAFRRPADIDRRNTEQEIKMRVTLHGTQRLAELVGRLELSVIDPSLQFGKRLRGVGADSGHRRLGAAVIGLVVGAGGGRGHLEVLLVNFGADGEIAGIGDDQAAATDGDRLRDAEDLAVEGAPETAEADVLCADHAGKRAAGCRRHGCR